jgi:hypothetical protein
MIHAAMGTMGTFNAPAPGMPSLLFLAFLLIAPAHYLQLKLGNLCDTSDSFEVLSQFRA